MSPSARSLLPELGSDPVADVQEGLPYVALERLQSHLDVSDARLEGTSPLDRMDTRVGMAEVTTMLGHIEHGMPA
jgi:hypothetical protein